MKKLIIIALLLVAGCATGPKPTKDTQFSFMPATTYRHTSVNLGNENTIYCNPDYNLDKPHKIIVINYE